jgi:hypothetical protein
MRASVYGISTGHIFEVENIDMSTVRSQETLPRGNTHFRILYEPTVALALTFEAVAILSSY